MPAESTVNPCGVLPVVTGAPFGPKLTVEVLSGVIFVTLLVPLLLVPPTCAPTV